MKSHIAKLVTFLAASGLNERELYTALREVHRHHPGELVNLVLDTRRFLHSGLPRTILEDYDVSSESTSTFFEVTSQVSEMLQGEANLGAKSAAMVLTESLLDSKIPREKIPAFRPKDGFGRWVARLAANIPPSVLLHHATRVRNRFVHRTKPDWPLKE